MNFNTSQKGAELGYIHRRGGKIKKGVSWRSTEAHCKGRLNILKNEIIVKNEHCHGPSPDSSIARKFKENVKERAELIHDKPETVRKLQIEFPMECCWTYIARCNQENGQPHQSNGSFPYSNAKNINWRCWHTWEPQNHPRRRRVPVFWQWIA